MARAAQDPRGRLTVVLAESDLCEALLAGFQRWHNLSLNQPEGIEDSAMATLRRRSPAPLRQCGGSNSELWGESRASMRVVLKTFQRGRADSLVVRSSCEMTNQY